MKKTILSPLLALAGCFAAFNGSSTLQAQTTNIWNFNYTGSIVDWTVPSTGYYHITAYGAQGGALGGGDLWYGNSGGLGAIMGGVFQLQAGSVLKLLVGEQGSFANVEMGGGGGGGSFVVGSNNTPLVVAGSGAGVAWGYGYKVGYYGQYNDQSYFSPNANTNTSGGSVGFSHDNSTNVIMTSGGINGNGGNVTTKGYGSGDNQGAAGAGFYGDGSSVTSHNTTWASGGQSYTNGGAGGSGGKTQDTAGTPNNGGFGGGGQGNSYGSGGGGGYSGGAGGPQVASEGDNPSAAGGGGSYLASDALHPTMSLGNTGNGQIIISTLSDLIVGDNASDQSTNFTSGINAYNSIFVGSAPGDTNNSITVTSPGTVLDSYNNIIVGENGFANYLDVSGGGRVNSNAAGVIGLNAGANSNYVEVTGITTHWSNNTSLTIGQSGSSNSLAIQEGGLVTAGGAGVALGYNVGSSGNSLLIDGVGSTLADSADFVVGFSGSSNAVVISNGGNLTNGQHSYGGVIGLNSGAINNSVLVTGNGSAWNNGGDLLVGWGDSGNTLTVSSGGAVTSSQVNYGGAIGFETGSNGNNIVVTGSGSSWSNSGDLLVGVSGSGNNMTISAGANVSSGQVNYGGVIGFDASSTNNIVLVTGTGSSWSNSGDLLVGVSGSGNNMTISAGGNVSSGQVNYGGVIGFDASSLNNSVLVTGTGSTWSNSSNLTIGDAGEGTLTIANGGSVSASAITIASQVGSTGTLNFGSLGGSDTAGSLIGPGISFGSGSGTINFNQVDSLIGSGFSGNGSLNQLGTGTTTLSGTNTYTGTTTVNSGTLVVQGQSSLGTSSVTVNGGTLVASGVFTEFPLALNAGNMTLTGAGSSWNTGTNTLIVGNNSPGVSLVVSNGASLTSDSGILGQDSGASNNSILVTGVESTWTNESSLYVGDRSSGNSVKVSAGATVSVFALVVGNYGSGNSLEVSDGGQLVTGGDGFGSCNIGFDTGSSNNSVLVSGSGSSWNNSGTMNIGFYGSGAVTVANGGSMTAEYLSISGYGGSGALNIGRLGSNDTAGTFSAWSLALGAGGVINFNQSDSTTFSTVISGNGSVNQLGSGTTTLAGNNIYTGTTTVTSGTLVSGNLSGSTLILQPGAAYSPGAVNSIGIVHVGGITLNGGDLFYNLGNATSDISSDRINSAGTAALNGPVVFEFSNLGYYAGNFTLLTGNGVSGFNTANLSYNAVGNFSVSGNFVVSGNSLLFQTTAPDAYTWDGGAGNGSWNAAANWVGDQAPPDWKTVHFAGSIQPNVDTNTDQSVLGIVFDANAVSFTINSTSNNTINLAGNIESDSPYDQTINCNINLVTNSVIAADAGRLAFGGLITFGENSKFLAISGANSTDITGNISGNGSLLKRGAGTLTLSGANTYDGETLINAGNLIIQGGAALKDSGIVKLAASGATFTVEDSETIGSLQGGGTTAIHSGQILTIAETGNATYSGAISGAGALTKTGSGTLTLSGSNNHTGGTTLSGGTLQLLHANALGSGDLLLSSGTLAVGNSSNSGGLLVPGHITWASSNAIVSLASTGNITTAGNFTHGGNVGNRTFDFGSGQYLQLGNNTLVNFGATTFNATHFQATYSPGTSLSGNFQVVGNSLVYVLQGGSASGSVINNSGTGGTQTWMDFTVNGSATTATGNNTIRSLTFANNGNLDIQSGHSLTLSQGQVAVQNGTSLVSGGTLATPGNFNKTGSGELDVQSTLAVNGTASIDAGLLSVNGQLIADSVVVNPNATLGGAGLIVGNVNVSGNLSPGNSPGTLAIAGNLALTGANSTLIEIASPTNFDRIVVSGSANLGGALNLVEFGGFEIAYGQQYAFLTAGGGISGEFDTITAPETFRGRFLNLGTTGVLLIAPDTYTRVAVTPNQREVAQALDSFIPATSGDRETVSIALDLQTAEQYPYAFEQIMPGFYESLANIAIEQTYNQTQLLTQRLGTVRLGAVGFQAIGMSQPIKYDKDGKSAADAKTASPIVESAIDTNWNSWVIANGEFSLSRGLSGVPNYNNNSGGFLVGADYRMSESFAAGLFAGYEYSYAKYNGGSSTAGNSALFGLYGSYTHEDGYYADAIVSGGYTGFQTRRSIEFSTIDRTASADPNSGQFSAALNLGKDFEIGKFTLGPIIGAQYTYAGIGGFTESGADSLDLALGQQNANSLRTNLGARLAYNWEVGSNITLIPEVRGFWMHEFLNNPRNINSALDGGNGASFDYETSAPYRNSVFGGAGISAKFADRWSTSVFYNVNFGAENYTNNIISTSLGFAF